MYTVAINPIAFADTRTAGGCAQACLASVDIYNVVVGFSKILDALGFSDYAVFVLSDTEVYWPFVSGTETESFVADGKACPVGSTVATLLWHHV